MKRILKIKKIIIEEGVEQIGANAFADCSAKEIVLPSTLKSLGSGCMKGMKNLEECIIPEHINIIPDKTF